MGLAGFTRSTTLVVLLGVLIVDDDEAIRESIRWVFCSLDG